MPYRLLELINIVTFVKKSCLIIFLLISFCLCSAQRSEVGTMIGTSFYLGDLNSFPFVDSKFAGGIIYRYNFTPRIALKANILFGTLTASDAKNYSLQKQKDSNGDFLVDDHGRYVYSWDFTQRGLSFTSPISEISAQIELNFFNLYNVGHKNQISPYLFGGVALFSFNPKALHKKYVEDTNGKYIVEYHTYDLQPIGTEGQGREGQAKKYAHTGFAIPFGIGFKANIGKFVCIGAEWGVRFTFTDYLDDVGGTYHTDFSGFSSNTVNVVQDLADPNPSHPSGAQRYSTRKNDWYSFAAVVITLRIGNEDRICAVKTNVKLKHKRKK
ncbi:MAG: DUF6089 family protein [Lentimicrobiaceae bacterium]|nr:DUF6089 family protein [Lentimicrobiaceae bacterium]